MKRCNELSDSDSCLNKAYDDEYIFVLLQRDIAMPDTIRFWCWKRIVNAKNNFDDDKIQTALVEAQAIDGKFIENYDELWYHIFGG